MRFQWKTRVFIEPPKLEGLKFQAVSSQFQTVVNESAKLFGLQLLLLSAGFLESHHLQAEFRDLRGTSARILGCCLRGSLFSRFLSQYLATSEPQIRVCLFSPRKLPVVDLPFLFYLPHILED